MLVGFSVLITHKPQERGFSLSLCCVGGKLILEYSVGFRAPPGLLVSLASIG